MNIKQQLLPYIMQLKLISKITGKICKPLIDRSGTKKPWVSVAMKKYHQWRKANAPTPKSHMARPVDQYTLDGKYIQTFPSAVAAAQALNIKRSNISASITGRTNVKTAGGFRWARHGEALIMHEVAYHTNRRSVEQYNLQGELVKTFVNTREAATAMNVKRDNIHHSIRLQRQHQGFFYMCTENRYQVPPVPKRGRPCKKKPAPTKPVKLGRNGKPVEQYNAKGELVATFISLKEASLVSGNTNNYLSNRIQGQKKCWQGCYWMYAENRFQIPLQTHTEAVS